MSKAPNDQAIARGCEKVFDKFGFHGAGMDRLLKAAGVSSRTLYKRFGSKEQLICAALKQRERRFFDAIKGDGIGPLFEMLAEWVEREGGRGCLYLRALGEFGEHGGPVLKRIDAYHERLRAEVDRRIAHELQQLGTEHPCPTRLFLVERVLLLFEGAATLCSYKGPNAARNAKDAAIALIENHATEVRSVG